MYFPSRWDWLNQAPYRIFLVVCVWFLNMIRANERFLIGGHRGVGENLWIEGKSAAQAAQAILPAFRENTIKSFLRSADLGVDFVEFDVQVCECMLSSPSWLLHHCMLHGDEPCWNITRRNGWIAGHQ